MKAFDKALLHLLKLEGGFVDHPADKGGATNLGITKATLSAWRKKAVTDKDMMGLTQEEAADIYRARYWDALGLDALISSDVALVIFDRAVNSGQQAATLIAQQTLNAMGVAVSADGAMGPATRAAINRARPGEFCKRYLRGCQIFYASICQRDPKQTVFLKGWLSRTHQVADAINCADV